MTVKSILVSVLAALVLSVSVCGAQTTASSAPPAKAPSAAEPPAVKKSSSTDPVSSTLVAKVATAPASYLLGPGDVLDISVWKDEALTRTVVVLPDGKISFPLVGEIVAGGRTVQELKQELEQKLTRYVPELVLSVDVKQSNSLLIYVIGRVNTPGRFMLNTNVNVLQALAMAGGLNPFAEKDGIKIYRYAGAKPEVFTFRYDEVAKKNRMEENIWLRQGDVILVP